MRLTLQSRASMMAFLTAFQTLFLQILIHRMVSAKLVNNYAFLVISLTMLGFAFAGVVLSKRLASFLARLHDSVAVSAALFGLTAVLSSAVFYHLRAGSQVPMNRQEFLQSLIHWVPFSLLFALPFVFAGLILGALLAAPDLSTRRIYGYDLLGSALGAFAAIPAITHLGVEHAALVGSAVLLLGAVILMPPRSRASWATAAAVLLILAAAWATSDRLFVIRYPEGSTLATIEEFQRQGHDYRIECVQWDPLARIEVSLVPPPNPLQMHYPALVGSNRSFHGRFKRMFTQNNFAFTYAVDYDGTPQSLAGIEETMYAAAYQARSVPEPEVLVIGVGGGFDILTALAFDASKVTGVEINRAIVRLITERYRDYFGKWVEDPRVRIETGEGRHYLSASDDRFDVIQLSGVDSYSGTPGAAHVFSENFLYTEQAFDLYLSRLTDDGILNMMRLEFSVPREMLRALATAIRALRRAGVSRPSDHITMLTQNNGAFTAMLVKRSPFSQTEVRRLHEWAAHNSYLHVSAAPGLNHERANVYQILLAANHVDREAAFISSYPYNIQPADDIRPFFFRFSFWWHVFTRDDAIRSSIIPVMEYSVLLLTFIVGLASLLCVYLPLRILAGTGLSIAEAPRRVIYFAGIGLGYLGIEIALLQRFGLFLGHPNYALSVVLAALLVSTGVGSLYSEVIVGRLRSVRWVSCSLAAVLLVEYWLLFPALPLLSGLPFWMRTATVFAMVLPIGMLLGVFMPHGLEQLKRASASPFVPWAWGINGIFSVLAPVLAIALSISWGSNALLLSAIPVYLGASLCLPVSER